MASSSRFTVLNLGMQTVTLAEFQSIPNGGLSLIQFQSTELLVDPGADAMRAEQVEAAVGQLKKATNIKGGPINYALPIQSVFTRYLSLPGSSPEELGQIIGFEAQQNIPFSIDEVVWDYQAVGEPRSGMLDVVLVAIKSDTLEEINKSVSANGFAPQVIDVAPLAIYNAFRFNRPFQEGCSLLIDVGARTTNLLFIENGRAYSRSVPIGGNSISVAIAKEFAQSIEAAEQIKKEKGFVSLGGAYSEPDDPVVAKIAKIARTTYTRLHAEIMRSISFYRANQGGSAPQHVFLAGGAVGMPFILEFFSEKMQVPVEPFNPFENVAISTRVDQQALAKNAHALGEVVGLALRNLNNTPVEINLRPPSVIRSQDLKSRKPFMVAAALCLVLAASVWGIYFRQAAAVKELETTEVTNRANALDALVKKFEAASRQQQEREATAAPLLLAITEREAWIRVLNELAAKLPPDFIWVTQLTPLSDGAPVGADGRIVAGSAAAARSTQNSRETPAPPRPDAKQAQAPTGGPTINALEIQGLYLENPKAAIVIDDFVNNLQTSSVFKIEETEKAKVVTKRSTPDDVTWAYGFTIVVPLANPITLP